MIEKIKPFSTFICGYKELDASIYSKLPTTIYYAFDIFSNSIFFSFAENFDSSSCKAFINYITESIKIKLLSIRYKPKFYTTNNKIYNSDNRTNNFLEINESFFIKKKGIRYLLEVISYSMKEIIIQKLGKYLKLRK